MYGFLGIDPVIKTATQYKKNKMLNTKNIISFLISVIY